MKISGTLPIYYIRRPKPVKCSLCNSQIQKVPAWIRYESAFLELYKHLINKPPKPGTRFHEAFHNESFHEPGSIGRMTLGHVAWRAGQDYRANELKPKRT